VTRKKPEGVTALLNKIEPPPIESLNMLDWYAAWAIAKADSAQEAFEIAELMLEERQRRLR
jgi:hypothetical protein